MTEQEWNSSTSIEDLRYFAFRNGTERKLRLFSCACCRRVWDQLSDARSKQAVIVAERFSDGLVTDAELESAAFAADAAWTSRDGLENDNPMSLSAAAYNVAIPMGWWGGAPAFQAPERIIREASSDPESEVEAQRRDIRDIFGSLFQTAFDPSWRTSTAVAIAKGLYDSRDFAAMPLLADALQDAGCADERILDHCRGPGPHVKGCWVVDLVLGKE